MIRALLLAIALAVSAGLYTFDLGRTPPHLGLDEAHFGVHAHALATTGRNLNGDAWPLFIALKDPQGEQLSLPWSVTWYQPFLFYLIAAALSVLPLSEAAIRMPMALIGSLVSVSLIYAVSWRLTGSRIAAIAAGAALALCPAHLILSRQALDFLAPVPFTLGWLWCLVSYGQRHRPAVAVAGGLILGAGCYSYITSWVLMPAYLVLSWAFYLRRAPEAWRTIGLSAAGFALPLLPLLPWFWTHPEMFGNIFSQYQASDGTSESLIRALGSGQSIATVARTGMATYWSYFDPSFLFFYGGASRSVSTGQVGVFLLATAILLPLGAIAVCREPVLRPYGWVLLAGWLTAPLLAVVKGTPFTIQRTAALLPFVSLLSAVGFAALWQSRRPALRWVALVLAFSGIMQFSSFYRDYHGSYRERSATSYDPTAFTGAAAFLLEHDRARQAPALYLTTPLYDIGAKWRFHATKHGQPELLARTRYFSGSVATLDDAPIGSLAVVEPTGRPGTDRWAVATVIHQLTGEPALVILRKIA